MKANSFLSLVFLLAALTARSEVSRTQTIALQKGWNSVFLQVSPTNRDPSSVFANTGCSELACQAGDSGQAINILRTEPTTILPYNVTPTFCPLVA